VVTDARSSLFTGCKDRPSAFARVLDVRFTWPRPGSSRNASTSSSRSHERTTLPYRQDAGDDSKVQVKSRVLEDLAVLTVGGEEPVLDTALHHPW
jgi:hypothetical protein